MPDLLTIILKAFTLILLIFRRAQGGIFDLKESTIYLNYNSHRRYLNLKYHWIVSTVSVVTFVFCEILFLILRSLEVHFSRIILSLIKHARVLKEYNLKIYFKNGKKKKYKKGSMIISFMRNNDVLLRDSYWSTYPSEMQIIDLNKIDYIKINDIKIAYINNNWSIIN